eukprot:1184091-Prorocentrum_minimum.AAC.1
MMRRVRPMLGAIVRMDVRGYGVDVTHPCLQRAAAVGSRLAAHPMGYGVDVRGYVVDVRGYGVDARGYGVDVRGYDVDVRGYDVDVTHPVGPCLAARPNRSLEAPTPCGSSTTCGR